MQKKITDLLRGKIGFDIRKQHNLDLIAFECRECGQTLRETTPKQNNLS